MKKRILASLLALVLCLTLLPVVQRADAAFVDLQFVPHVFDPTLLTRENYESFDYNYEVTGNYEGAYCSISYGGVKGFAVRLFGEETLPAGVEPSGVRLTKLEWSPGTAFSPAGAHIFRDSNLNGRLTWKDENARVAYFFADNYSEATVMADMEAAGLSNTDPFTVRATQSWSGGEYTFDYTFSDLQALHNLQYYGSCLEGLNEPPFALKQHVFNNDYIIWQPTVKKQDNGLYGITFKVLKKKSPTGTGYDEFGIWVNSVAFIVVPEKDYFTGGGLVPSHGAIDCRDTFYPTASAYKNPFNSGRQDSPDENYDMYEFTLSRINDASGVGHNFEEGESVSIIAVRETSYSPDSKDTNTPRPARDQSWKYYHDPAWTFNCTFGSEAPETHTLTVNYALAGGLSWPGGAPEPYTEQIMEGVTYNIPSPEFAGLAPDIEVVTGTMGKEDQTVTVTYGTAHTLTVNYELAPGVELPAGRSLPSACVMQVLEGGAYTVVTPKLADLTPDKESVIGTMETEDVSVTVTYYARVSVTGEAKNGNNLDYTVRYSPANALLIAARYDEAGRLTYARTVAVPAGHSHDTLAMGGTGGKYKLLLVDGTTLAPLCRAWDSADA